MATNFTEFSIDTNPSGDTTLVGHNVSGTGEIKTTINQILSAMNLATDSDASFVSITQDGNLVLDVSYFTPQTLTDAETISYDVNNGVNAKVTLGGDRTLAAITNAAEGQSGTLTLIQDGTGGRSLTLDASQVDMLATVDDIASMGAGEECEIAWRKTDSTNFKFFIRIPVSGGGGGGGATTYNITSVDDDGHVSSSRTSSTTIPSSFSSISKNSSIIMSGAEFDDEEIELIYFVSYFRFQNVAIDQGATIQSAILKPIKKGGSSSNSVDYEIGAMDSDNTSAPTSANHVKPINATTARVTMPSSTVTSATNGERFDSPDIKTVIQEIVDRSGWSSGNAITIIMYTPTNVNGGSSVFGRFGSADGTDESAQLEITL